ncbi:hypothetical protein ACFVT5_14745 [Streptomyces sp. NPDC058001]|uniref:hypothetical protein n=1 Tax=Streptomyces sp. NPDC058001 TaxID=3346300 RepID=UPI0036E9A69B
MTGTSWGPTCAPAWAGFAVAAFFTPVFPKYSARVLLWSITACAAISIVVGVHIVRA